MSERIRVVVVDDHPIFCAGVIQTLKGVEMFNVVGKGNTASDAVQLAKELSPDVMLLDLSLPGGGIEAAKKILQDDPAARIIMLTVSDSEENVASCLEAGVKGYILKGVGQQELASGVRAVHNGGSYVSAGLLARLFVHRLDPTEADGSDELTAREQEILDLVSQRLTNKEIGETLSVSVKTIKNHMSNIMRKLKVKSRWEAVYNLKQRTE